MDFPVKYRFPKIERHYRFIYPSIQQIKMKKIKLLPLLLGTLFLFSSCSKSDDEGETCQDTNSTKVTYSNTTNTALRVVVSTRLTPQFEPVDPLFTLDLAPGQSVVKEFLAGRYINSWYNNCASSCNRMSSSSFKDFNSCEEYEEKR